MQIPSTSFDSALIAAQNTRTAAPPQANAANDTQELRAAFDTFVGNEFFGQMLSAMRKTLGKPAYFHGGRGEEVFQKHLDQTMAEEMTKASAGQFSGPMFAQFELCQLARR